MGLIERNMLTKWINDWPSSETASYNAEPNNLLNMELLSLCKIWSNLAKKDNDCDNHDNNNNTDDNNNNSGSNSSKYS